MKTRRTRKHLAYIILAAMAVMIFSTVVNAASNYSPVAGPAVNFTKYLVVPKDTAVPNLTFNFTVSAGNAVSGTESVLPIYAGNDSKRVVFAAGKSLDDIVGSAAFPSGAATTDGTSTDKITNDDTKKYDQKIVTLDFSILSFKEPGIYRYIITEDPVSGATTDSPKTLDIYVKNGDSGSLAIDGYVMYNSEGNKTDCFINQYPSCNLYVGKVVEGNQASKDKYFRFAVEITKATPNSKINLGGSYNYSTAITNNTNGATVLAGVDGDSYTNPNPTTGLTTNANGEVTAVFYLQGDQYVEIMGISENAHYKVSEEDYSADGYKATSAEDVEFLINSISFNGAIEGDIGTTDIKTGFKNSKSGSIPTGIIISVAGLLIVGIVAVIGLILFGIRSKNRYEEG